MPALIDMSLFKAAMATTSPPWKGLQGKQDEAHSAFTSSIMANQQTDAALGAALSPIFSAAGGVLGGLAQSGVQSLFGTGAAASTATSGVMQGQAGGALLSGATGQPLSGLQNLQYGLGQNVTPGAAFVF